MTLQGLPTYIVDDKSGIDKETLFKKHLEIKQSFKEQMPAEYTNLKSQMDEVSSQYSDPDKNVGETVKGDPIPVAVEPQIREVDG